MVNYLTPNTTAPVLLVPGDISAILPSEAVYSAKPQGQHHTRPQGKYDSLPSTPGLASFIRANLNNLISTIKQLIGELGQPC